MTEQTDTVTCKFPGCQNPPEPATDKPGRPPGTAPTRRTTAATAWRERKRLAAIERGTTTSDAEAEQPVTMARVNGAELLRQMRELADTLAATAERLTSAVADLGDPAAAEAEVEAARTAAEKRAAAAEAAGPRPSAGRSPTSPRHSRRGRRGDERAPGRRAGRGARSARPADRGHRRARRRARADPRGRPGPHRARGQRDDIRGPRPTPTPR